MSKGRLVQVVALLMAAVALLVTARTQEPLDRLSEEHELAPSAGSIEGNPEQAVLTMAPGGLRAPMVNYLWIRSQQLKDEGQYYDAMQLAEWICQLQPRFPGVWAFHAWNMAWNISVATHTPEERWLWVNNGVRLLRDRGIPMNRKSLVLYKELAWIFFQKMGEELDEMHRVYKQRWAAEMQRVLGAPPQTTTAKVIDHFRPVAEAPLDKDFGRQGVSPVQKDVLAKLLEEDPDAKAYHEQMSQLGVEVGWGLLDAWNKWSEAPGASVVRVYPPRPATDEEKALFKLISAPGEAGPERTHLQAGREKLLAFSRSQILWNEYRLDPQWMLEIMERYNAPLDWRDVLTHGLYWITLGVEVSEYEDRSDIVSLNTVRTAMNSMKGLTFTGRLTYRNNPNDPDSPELWHSADPRFIEPTHQLHIQFATEAIESLKAKQQAGNVDRTAEILSDKVDFDQNVFKSGHINYLVSCIQMLVAYQRTDEARKYLTYIQKDYNKTGPEWDYTSVEQFAVDHINREGRPIPEVAFSQISASLTVAFVHLSQGNAAQARQSYTYAQRVYQVFQKNAPDRLKFPPFLEMATQRLVMILLDPRSQGYNLSVPDRSVLYKSVELPLQQRAYFFLIRSPRLIEECQLEGIGFGGAFPKPAGYDAFEESILQRVPGQVAPGT